MKRLSLVWLALFLVSFTSAPARGVSSASDSLPSLLRTLALNPSTYSALEERRALLALLDLDWEIEAGGTFQSIWALSVTPSPRKSHYLLAHSLRGEWSQHGEAKYCLLDSLGAKLWQATGEISAPPRVSDAGWSATLAVDYEGDGYTQYVNIQFRDPLGQATGIARLKHCSRPVIGSFREAYGFSPGADLFLTTVNDPLCEGGNATSLHCLTTAGKEDWRRELGGMAPSTILFSGGGDRIIVHDFGGAAAARYDYVRIFSPDGEIIGENEIHHRVTRSRSVFSQSQSRLYYYESRSGLSAIDIHDGSLRTELPAAALDEMANDPRESTRRSVELLARWAAEWQPLPEREAMPPLWRLRVEADSLHLEVNRFSELEYQDRFPLPWLSLRVADPHARLLARLPVKALRIDGNGVPERNTLAQAPFLRATDHAFTTVVCPTEGTGTIASANGESLPELSCEDFFSMTVIDSGRFLVATSEQATVLVDLESGTVLPLASMRSWNVQYAGGTGTIAAILYDDKERMGCVGFWNRSGERIDSLPWREEDYDYLKLFSRGDYLHCMREESLLVSHAIAENRTDTLMGNARGAWRYYSQDESRMLIVSRARSQARMYDVTRPDRPVLVSETFLASGEKEMIESVAVSPDGSLVALRIQHHGTKSTPFGRVLVLDGRLERRAILLRNTTAHGLHFSGEFLFSGFAPGSDSFNGTLNSSTIIRVFDAAALQSELR